MANYPGAGADTFSGIDYLFVSAPLQIPEFAEQYFDPDDSDAGTTHFSATDQWSSGGNPQIAGPVTFEDYRWPVKIVDGAIAPAFSHDFYNRIHVGPNPADFGSLLEPTDLTVEIWNAFFEPSEYVDHVLTDFLGLELEAASVPPPPITIPALHNHTFKITATTEGPSSIAALMDFLITTTTVAKPVPTLRIIGKRGKLFPFVTSWAEDPVEEFAWKTNILKTDDQHERRYQLREWPRRSFRIGMEAVGASAADLRVALLGNQAEDYALPLWMYESFLTDPASIGETTIYVDTTDNDFQVGGSAMLLQSQDKFETVTILSVADDHLVLKANKALSQDWPAGTAIYPIRVCRINERIPLNAVTGNVVNATVNLEAVEQEKTFDAPAVPYYLGIPCITTLPDWGKGRPLAYIRHIDELDAGIYPKQFFNLSPGFQAQNGFSWFLNGRSTVKQFLALMQYLSGRYKTVWLPTWQEDFVLAQAYVTGQTVVTVKGNFASQFMRSNVAEPAHVRLRLKDGTEYRDQLLAATANSVNPNNDDLFLKNGWVGDFEPYWVENFCMMYAVRLVADRVRLVWKTPQMALAETPFIYAPDQPE